MDRLGNLEEKVKLLEERVRKLEESEGAKSEDGEFMDVLFAKARAMAEKKEKITVITLQKKFLIDFERASGIIARLKSAGVLN